jgi:hypothetical protein
MEMVRRSCNHCRLTRVRITCFTASKGVLDDEKLSESFCLQYDVRVWFAKILLPWFL